MKTPHLLTLAAGLLLSLTPAPARAQATTNPTATNPAVGGSVNAADTSQHWWNDRVFYEIFVRSFADSTSGPLSGDGVGDLRGIIEKLDYLNDGDPATTTDLGITGIWLMPINPSPSYHGYDITDYNDINPAYGSMDDFKELLAACHARGIAVIIDFVANHCSRNHPWFQEAKNPESDTRDWFIWSDTDPAWKGPWNQQVWHRIPAPGGGTQFYYGLFSSHMPDFNFRNDAATAAILGAVDFWKGVGVDGLRLDAIRHLIETDRVQESTPETHEWLRTRFYPATKADRPNFLTIGEVWADSRQASSYVGDQMDLVFEFATADAMLAAARSGNAARAHAAFEEIARLYPLNQFGSFLTNHDQGRIANQLRHRPGPMRAAAAMLLLGPGVPFLYYGEEIGMTGDKPDELIRTPMQWSADRNAGFSAAPPWQAPNGDWTDRNVAAQAGDPESLLSHYRRLIALRNGSVDLRCGSLEPIRTGVPDLLAFVRSAVPKGGAERTAALVIINLGGESVANLGLSTASPVLDSFTTATNLVDGTAVSTPEHDGLTGFDGYAPAISIPAFGFGVIEFR